jgi:hypothetical protein
MGMLRQIRKVHPLSIVPLYIQIKSQDEILSTATSFIVKHNNLPYLITNWHVVSGLDAVDGKRILSDTGLLPTAIIIFCHSINRLGTWVSIEVELYDGLSHPLWLQHPFGRLVDVVAIPMNPTVLDSVAIYPIAPEYFEADIRCYPGMDVNIIGFPYGKVVEGRVPIWKTGHLASDPDLNYHNLPCLLVDITGREGMSGSPVIVSRQVGYVDNSGIYHADSGIVRFLGIYSGSIKMDSEIGMVWKASVLDEIID